MLLALERFTRCVDHARPQITDSLSGGFQRSNMRLDRYLDKPANLSLEAYILAFTVDLGRRAAAIFKSTTSRFSPFKISSFSITFQSTHPPLLFHFS
ncbi:hypothetical protein Ancab_008056 [Ancistrocladus abbreviatus]